MSRVPYKICPGCCAAVARASARCRHCGAALTARQRAKDAAEALAAMQAACDRFNARHAIGATVMCWPGPREGAPVPRTVSGPACVLSGHTAVVYVSGGGGCIALSHVETGSTSARE